MIERVLILHNKFPDADLEKEVFADADIGVETAKTDSDDEIIRIASDVDAILTQGVKYDRELLEALSHLDAISVYGTGTDSVDLTAAREEGIHVLNVPEYCTDEVSTHALTLILACLRNIIQYDTQVKRGEWDWTAGSKMFRTSELTLGVVGYGSIASSLATKCQPVFETISAFDPYVEDFDSFVQSTSFDDLLPSADIITIHTPLTEETRHMFGSEEFQTMKDTSVLVNVARGSIVNVDAMYTALVEGEISSAGLDVFPTEPPDPHPLFGRDDVVISPHVAWYSETAERELRRSVATGIVRLSQGESPTQIVGER